MDLLYFFLLVLATQLNFQSCVQAEESLYECYAYTDPHVQTWRLKGTQYTPQQYQDCYRPGYVPLVKNEFVHYKVNTEKKWMVELELYFYDGTSKIPRCLIISENFEMYPDDEVKCREYGITWGMTRTATNYMMSISYTKANFLTTLQHDYYSRTYAPHFNIFVWQPSSLVERSTGVCKKSDPQCQLTARTTDSKLDDEDIQPGGRTITHSQAQAICKSNVNAYLGKSRRAPYQRSATTNDTIAGVLASCEADLILTGFYQAARSSVNVLMIDELTNDMTSIDSIQTAIESGGQEALVTLEEAAEEADAEVSEMLGLTTTTPKETTSTSTSTNSNTVTVGMTTAQATTTTSVPRGSYKCAVYSDLYVQPWHPTNQALPPTRSCLGTSGNFELVKNKYVRYTIHTSDSIIDDLTLILFDETSTNAICTVSAVGQDAGWMDCEENGITPSLIKTATHETLTVYYAKANFTTIVTTDIGVNVGRLNINIYQNVELVDQSTGICDVSSCSRTIHVEAKKRFRRGIN